MRCLWSSSELELEFKEIISDDIVKLLLECNPMYDMEEITDLNQHIIDGNSFTIYPSISNLFICDNQFIQNCSNPIALFKYYEKKIDDDRKPLTITFNDKEKIEINELSIPNESSKIYRELLETVIIDIGSLNKSSITIPPEVFHMLTKYHQNDYYCKYISELLSLIAISDRVIALDDDLKNFEFHIFTKEYVKKIKHSWLDYKSLNSGYWYSCYKWITADGQKSVDVNLKRHIVKEGVTKYYTEERYWQYNNLQERELINIFDNIFRLIVSDRTQEYFETQKVLKNEYIEIYSRKYDLFANVANEILALIIALAAGMYGIIFTQGENFEIFTPNKTIGILLVLMLIAEIFILTSTIAKLKSHKSYLDNLRKINTEKLMITDQEQKYFSYKVSLINYIYIVLAIMLAITIVGVWWSFQKPVIDTEIISDIILAFLF